MHLRNTIWKIATLLVVLFHVSNPELFELAVFIDTIGLELFLLLLEAQLFVFVSSLYANQIKKSVEYLKNIFTCKIYPDYWLTIKENPIDILYIMPSASTLMVLLVLSVISGPLLSIMI